MFFSHPVGGRANLLSPYCKEGKSSRDDVQKGKLSIYFNIIILYRKKLKNKRLAEQCCL